MKVKLLRVLFSMNQTLFIVSFLSFSLLLSFPSGLIGDLTHPTFLSYDDIRLSNFVSVVIIIPIIETLIFQWLVINSIRKWMKRK